MAEASRPLFSGGYSPVGDVLVLATVLIIVVLIRTVYIRPNDEFRIYKHILGLLVIAACSNIIYNICLIYASTVPDISIYALRIVYHLALFLSFALYITYMEHLLQLSAENERRFFRITIILIVVFALLDVYGTISRTGFYIDSEGVVHSDKSIYFAIEYILFVAILLYIMIKYSERIYKPLMVAFVSTTVVSVVMMLLQGIFHQHSYTTSTFLFLALSVLYLIHASPYDPEMGSLHADAFEERIAQAVKSKKELVVFSLFLRDYQEPGKKYPKEIRDTIRDVVTNYFKGANLFQISGGRMLLVVDIARNPDYETATKKILEYFDGRYADYQLDYKIVITKSHESLNKHDLYLRLIEYIENRMPINDVRYVGEAELEKFHGHQYIVEELADINEKKNLLDPRVVVFCQPVFNVRTGKFDTAEALMRMKLDKIGTVYPDRFIPIAEKHNYIHMLSMIILAQTCHEIRKLLDEGYNVSRISVNFSILDVKEKDFCDNVKKIVSESGIPFEKVAIEITESQNESDFMMVKEKLTELKDSGITFYLDDFGTGYSNFERIMELPFDIIKFDRSLVIASNNDPKSETMVQYLAHMFTDMNYAILYEGVENEKDEALCRKMYARYLQGYKYSKPIPIERLTEFFEKIN